MPARFDPFQCCIDCKKHLPSKRTKRCKQCYIQSNSQTNLFWRYAKKGPGCWIWNGCKSNGYGIVGCGKISAHRFSYEFHKGKIPPKMHVCHRCDNPSCVNPSHLFIGTIADNMRDKVAKQRHARGTMLPITKLTPSKIKEIRKRYIPWIYPCTRLSKEFGTHYRNIWMIVKNKTWRHVS